ncbi:hypothetical protein LU604_08250 [Erwinia tracheiphila]|uniref:hypothetical protein n=1 Tax=Erwinia tracheiphila TaxID=65700 RepID=UPI001F3D8D4B|nr:hypothetical protein [Erwinia tracheiphila]UIA85863.1 hypothetical protein LU604_08250 [Erwinia tracheiphila]
MGGCCGWTLTFDVHPVTSSQPATHSINFFILLSQFVGMSPVDNRKLSASVTESNNHGITFISCFVGRYKTLTKLRRFLLKVVG